MKMELRVNRAELRVNNDGTLTVEGYVNKTNQYSELLGRTEQFREKIAPGAFTRGLERAKEVHFLAEHDGSKILASTRNGSLQLQEDNEGLHMRATISPTSWGKDYYQLIEDGILGNMSFGFRSVKDQWTKGSDGYFERTVNDLDLFEVSVVRDPAYPQSQISARGIDLVEDVVPEDVKEEARSTEAPAEEQPTEARQVIDVDALTAALLAGMQTWMAENWSQGAPQVPDADVTVVEDGEVVGGEDVPVEAEPEDGDGGADDPDDDDPEEETLEQPATEEEELSRSKELKDFIKRFR